LVLRAASTLAFWRDCAGWMLRIPAGSRTSHPTQMQRIAQRQQEAETRAFRECLRLRGLSRGGGVEALRRPGLF
jgi:hypothetical protein